MELKVTSEKVVEAAKSCPDADRILRTLFPEAFPPPVPKLILPRIAGSVDNFVFPEGHRLRTVMYYSMMEDDALYLDAHFSFEVVTTPLGQYLKFKRK